MRKPTAALVVLVTAAIAACSGMDSLSPSTSDRQGGAPSHGDDTAVVSGPRKPQPPPPVVPSFALSGVVSAHQTGTDTTLVVPVPNAKLTLVRVADVTGDTLVPSVTVTSTTTDAQGAYRLENLTPAYYRVDVTAPVGSAYADATSGIGPARETEVKLFISLARKP